MFISFDRKNLRVMDSCELNLKATELRLGLPGSDSVSPAKTNKRSTPESGDAAAAVSSVTTERESAPPPPK